MQLNYELMRFRGTPIASPSRATTRTLPAFSATIIRARRQQIRAEAWETLTWAIIGLCSLIAIAISLWQP